MCLIYARRIITFIYVNVSCTARFDLSNILRITSEGLLHSKPVQGLRLTNYISGFTPNQLKIDPSLYQLGDRSPILMATSDYLPVIQILIKGTRQLFHSHLNHQCGIPHA